VFEELLTLYDQLGFAPTIEHDGQLDGSNFCKIMFRIYNGKTYGYPDPYSALVKLGWTTKTITSWRQAKRLLESKLVSFEH